MDPTTQKLLLGAGKFDNPPDTFDLFGIGGGGGSGSSSRSGGGGGGQARIDTNVAIPEGVIHVNVGAGGYVNINGGYSQVLDKDYAIIKQWMGGGAGGRTGVLGVAGACGGGGPGGSSGTLTGGTGIFGNNGGNGRASSFGSSQNAGGGGGLSTAGQSATTSRPGNGGDGSVFTFAGTEYPAGAGGGGMAGGSNTTNGIGGSCGTFGRCGATGNQNVSGGLQPAVANTGSGGGGLQPGSSGLVVIAYPDTYDEALEVTGDYTFTTSGGYHVYKFTGSGSIRFIDGASVPFTSERLYDSVRYYGGGSNDTLQTDVRGPESLVITKRKDSTLQALFFDNVGDGFIADGLATNTHTLRPQITFGGSIETGYNNGWINAADEYDLYHFKVHPKVFDIVEYTGDGSNTARAIPHSLATTPGLIFLKSSDSFTSPWWMYHHSQGNDFFATDDQTTWTQNANYWGSTDPTATHFYVGDATNTNANGVNYRAFIWPIQGEDDNGKVIIKTGKHLTTDTVRDLGFEPNFLMYKVTGSGYWSFIGNTSRVGHADSSLTVPVTDNRASFAANGWQFNDSGFERTGLEFVYIAWRIDEPDVTTGSEVLDIFSRQGTSAKAFVSTDWDVASIWLRAGSTSSSTILHDRRFATEKALFFDTLGAAITAQDLSIEYQDQKGFGFSSSNNNLSSVTYHNWAWRYVPTVYTSMMYTGNDQFNTSIAHNHQAAPDVMLIKSYDITNVNTDWYWVWNDGGTLKQQKMNSNDAWANASIVTSMDASQFTVNTISDAGNNLGNAYLAQMWSTKAGVCKVGKYTGTGTAGLQVDCGFSTGARAVLLLDATNGANNWYITDTVLGWPVSSTNFPYLQLNGTAAGFSANGGYIAYSAGFETTGVRFNQLNTEYFFIALS